MFKKARRFLLIVALALIGSQLHANMGSLDTASEVMHETIVPGWPSTDVQIGLILQTRQANGGAPVYTATLTMMNVSKVPQTYTMPTAWVINGKVVHGSESAKVVTLEPGVQKKATQFRWSGLVRGRHFIDLGLAGRGGFSGQIIAEQENDTHPKVVFARAFRGC